MKGYTARHGICSQEFIGNARLARKKIYKFAMLPFSPGTEINDFRRILPFFVALTLAMAT